MAPDTWLLSECKPGDIVRLGIKDEKTHKVKEELTVRVCEVGGEGAIVRPCLDNGITQVQHKVYVHNHQVTILEANGESLF